MILKKIYPENEIFVNHYFFNDKNKLIEASCIVPMESNYAKNLVPYVTAENFIRCISQSSYLLSHHLIKEKILPIEISEKEFLSGAKNYDFYYRNLPPIKFIKKINKGETFKLIIDLQKVRRIKNLNDSFFFTFFIQKTIIIGGETTFIYKKQPT